MVAVFKRAKVGHMNTRFIEIAAVIGAVLIAAPVIADEAPAARPVRHIARAPVEAPARAAPVQQANWTGGQVGGQGGVSSMAQGFAEPGAHLFPDPATCAVPGFGSYCLETPFAFTGHNSSATGGAFLGMPGAGGMVGHRRRNRCQLQERLLFGVAL